MDKNLMLVMLVMAALVFGSQFFLRKNAPPPTNTAQQHQAAQPNAQALAATPPAQASPGTTHKGQSAPQPATKQASAESQIVVENDVYKITFTNRGAQAKSWILKKYFDDQGHPLDLVNSVAAPKFGYPLSLWTYDESLRTQLNSVLYLPSTTAPTLAPPSQLVFEYSDAGLTVRKTFHFDQTYVIGVETSVLQGGSPVSAFPAWPAGFGDQNTLPLYASSQLDYQVNGDTEHTSVKKLPGGNTLHGTYNWIGASSTYFGAIFIPDSAENLQVVTLHNAVDVVPDPNKPNETKPADVVGVAVGRPGAFSGRLFAGPKALDVLDSIKVPTIVGADKDLRNLVNFGWFAVIARPLFAWKYIGLRWFYNYTHNWGWAIVIQTFIINLLMFPLVVYQMKSALKMQKVQPQMKAIQEKYKKYSMRDPRKQEMQKEIAELYKHHGVNPVGGCLPLLVQLPFLYAYYRTLGTAIDLRQAHWLWIHDLSGPDWILPLVMAISMFLSQRMTPQPGVDPAQQKMLNWVMPVFMGYLFFRFPSGLNLYYAESNFIRMGQQWIMNQTELGREIKEIAAKRARKKDK